MKRKETKPKQAKASKTVLVADDSPIVRRIVELALVGLPIEVETAAGGTEALERLGQKPPDLLLVDAVMPGPDGYEICERVKAGEFGARPSVVLLSDVFEPFDTSRATAAGLDGHIVKPFDTATLRLMLSDQLGIELPAQRSAGAPALYAPAPAPDASASHGEAAPASGSDGSAASLSAADMDAMARRIVSMMSADVVREIAWEVVPELSEVLIKERMRGG